MFFFSFQTVTDEIGTQGIEIDVEVQAAAELSLSGLESGASGLGVDGPEFSPQGCDLGALVVGEEGGSTPL
jgi:hypothetical protein